MKVSTDGILLGAWADVSNCQRILDMGTGTGLVALMLAQRSHEHCQIEAVELDPLAAQQAQENFKASPWYNRLHLTHQDVQTYCQKTAHQFDLIVANPPYFAQGVECKNDERALARYVQQNHSDWLNWAASCLSGKGKISFVLPYEAGKTLINSTSLYCIKQTDVITKMSGENYQTSSEQHMLTAVREIRQALQVQPQPTNHKTHSNQKHEKIQPHFIALSRLISLQK